MQILAEVNGSSLKAEGRELVYTLNAEKRSGYLYTNALRINLAQPGNPPIFRHFNITLASEDGVLPSPADIADYTILVTIDIAQNELPVEQVE